jgi:hypothetical protein
MPRSFVPTDEERQKVKSMAGFGLKHEQIATLMGIGSAATLRKHFRTSPLKSCNFVAGFG